MNDVNTTEFDLASPMRRFSAALINYVIFFAIGLLSAIFIPMFIFGYDDRSSNAAISVIIGISMLIVTIINLYFIITSGQTIGKKILGIRVVKTDGSHAGFLRFFLLRELAYNAIVGIAIAAIAFIISIAMGGINDKGFDKIINILNFVPIFICINMMRTSPNRRTLQDLLADTVVIRVK